jgi:hypothetical protein
LSLAVIQDLTIFSIKNSKNNTSMMLQCHS